MENLKELELDLKELKGLGAQAKRPNVRQMLQGLMTNVENDIITARSLAITVDDKGGDAPMDTTQAPAPAPAPAPASTPAAPLQQRKLVKQITKFGHDQSDKFVTIYVDLDGVESKNVKVDFFPTYAHLKVLGLKGEDYELLLKPLFDFILPEQSKHKVTKGKVKLMLRKKEERKNWPNVKGQPRPEPEPKLPIPDVGMGPMGGSGEDPGESMMKLLKNMYDQGDDEMKKTIARAWQETRNPQLAR